MSRQRTPSNIYEDGQAAGVSTEQLALVIDPATSDVVVARNQAPDATIEWNPATGDWCIVAVS